MNYPNRQNQPAQPVLTQTAKENLARVPEVVHECDRLDSLIQRAEKTFEEVQVRLISIRFERPDSPEEDLENECRTELGKRIQRCSDRLEALCERMVKLLEELEV